MMLGDSDRKMLAVLSAHAMLLSMISAKPDRETIELARGILFLPKTLNEIAAFIQPNTIYDELEYSPSFIDAPDAAWVAQQAASYRDKLVAKAGEILARSSGDTDGVLYDWLREVNVGQSV